MQHSTSTLHRYRLAVDIGGTFTDAVLFDESSGEIARDKVLTTADEPSLGFLECISRLSAREKIKPEQFTTIVHGTTIATNALLERRGARVGLLITAGFRDIVEIGRQIRHDLYDLQLDKPMPLVSRELCIEVRERVNYAGDIVLDLDDEAVDAAAEEFLAAGVESIAICFLHAYRNPLNEQRAAAALKRRMPDIEISVSSDIAPEIREYWRASTAVTNAYVAPCVTGYLGRLADQIKKAGITVTPHIMQSSGGLMSIEQAKRRPIFLLESGPAAGVISAAYFARLCRLENAIAFDMGGTTAKMGVIEGGTPRVVPEFEAGGVHGTGSGVAPGSGYPILAPTVDLVEVGAGGGSLAWIDAGGLMRVGPKSASSKPGPACYGRGGTEPTLTDANLILGRLSPDFFLGGEMMLDRAAARRAIEERVALPLGISVEEAALGMLDIAVSHMSEVIRLVTVQRGLDPRDFALVATGGAGPAVANLLAAELQLPKILVPPSPGTASAFGMLVSEMRHEMRTTQIVALDVLDPVELSTIFEKLEERVLAAFFEDGINQEETSLSYYVEMRYVGQSWTIPIQVIKTNLSTIDDIKSLRQGFDQEHQRLYGYNVPEDHLEIVNFGALGVAQVPRPRLRNLECGSRDAGHALKTRRDVVFRGYPRSDCAVYDRRELLSGNVILGPAIIEEVDSTTVLLPHYEAEVVDHGVLLIRPKR